MHISTLLPQSPILVKLAFRPTPAVHRRKFQASELIISSAQATNQFWGNYQPDYINYFKKKYNVIKVSLPLCFLS